jgi:uncharacterized protein
MQISLFGKSHSIEADIDNFLNKISEAGILFEQLIKHYIRSGANDNFKEEVARMDDLENATDELSKRIGRALYTEMLIPDLRADVLSLMQDLNYLVGVYANIANSFDIEQPDHSRTTNDARRMYGELLDNAVQAVEMTVVSARAFFRDINAVEDHVHKVGYYENEADIIATKLKRLVFSQEIPLELKMQFRYFIDALEELADDANDASEWISIYAIKRSL